MTTERCGGGLSRLEKRSIEARAIEPVIRAVAARIGWDEAVSILIEINQDEGFRRGRRIAQDFGGNGIVELARDVDEWGLGGAWEMEVLERTESTYSFNVTRCPYFELYRELGMEELGVALSCCRDEPFARGFNPRLRLTRTRTIMEGANHCDFRYSLEIPKPGDQEGCHDSHCHIGIATS